MLNPMRRRAFSLTVLIAVLFSMFQPGTESSIFAPVQHNSSEVSIKSLHPSTAPQTIESDVEITDGEEESDSESGDLFLEYGSQSHIFFSRVLSFQENKFSEHRVAEYWKVYQPIYLVNRNFRL